MFTRYLLCSGLPRPLPQFHDSFCNPHNGREGKPQIPCLANDILLYWQVCPYPAQSSACSPPWSFGLFEKLVVPCICASLSISDKGLRCDWTIQQKNIQNQIRLSFWYPSSMYSCSCARKYAHAPHSSLYCAGHLVFVSPIMPLGFWHIGFDLLFSGLFQLPLFLRCPLVQGSSSDLLNFIPLRAIRSICP